jgi:hypothetical protein
VLIRIWDPGCLSRIPDPDFHPSPIPYPTTAPKEEREKYFVCPSNFCSHKYHKIVYNFIFEQVKKIFLAKSKTLRIIVPKNLSLSYQKYGLGIRDPRSGIRKKTYPDPRSRVINATLVLTIYLCHTPALLRHTRSEQGGL